MSTKDRLGRGLESLIPTDIDDLIHSTMPEALQSSDAVVQQLEVNKIIPNPHQPRSTFDEESIAEMAAQGKPSILVPNAELTGGHQVKNAEFIASKKAALIISEHRLISSPEVLVKAVEELITSPHKRAELGENLHQISVPSAANSVAELILNTSGKGSGLPR